MRAGSGSFRPRSSFPRWAGAGSHHLARDRPGNAGHRRVAGSYGYEYDLSQSPEDLAVCKQGADWWHANCDWLSNAKTEIQDQGRRQVHAKIAADGSRFALWVVQCDSALDAVADPIRLPLKGVFACKTVMDSNQDEWARARFPAASYDETRPMAGAWIATHGLPVPSLLVGQAILIEGVRQ